MTPGSLTPQVDGCVELRFVVEGLPSTDHRARSSSRIVRGKVVTRHHKSAAFAAWKERMSAAALAARPRGWPLDLRYAVECMGYLPSQRYDADNLRGLPDACQGILWANDSRVRPITYDYDVDKNRPRLEVQIVAYDPRDVRAVKWVELMPKIDITIGKTPCSPDSGPAELEVPSCPLRTDEQKPRGAATPGARPNRKGRLDDQA